MNKLVIPAILAATVLLAGMFALMPIEKATTIHSTLLSKRFIVQSDNLSGLPSGALFPYIDSTPDTIGTVHVAVADETTDCTAGAAVPSNVNVLIGQAGVSLSTNVLVAATNTGIGTINSCVFHETFTPGATVNGVPIPNPITDIVVTNVSATALPTNSTITVSAEVDDTG